MSTVHFKIGKRVEPTGCSTQPVPEFLRQLRPRKRLMKSNFIANCDHFTPGSTQLIAASGNPGTVERAPGRGCDHRQPGRHGRLIQTVLGRLAPRESQSEADRAKPPCGKAALCRCGSVSIDLLTRGDTGFLLHFDIARTVELPKTLTKRTSGGVANGDVLQAVL